MGFGSQLFTLQQCEDLAYFDAVPAPFTSADVTAVFWQIGFGNETAAAPSSAGTGMLGPSLFVGNDSGSFVLDVRDGPSFNQNLPAGSVCLSNQNRWYQIGVDGCCDNSRLDYWYSGPYGYYGMDGYLNPFFNTALAGYGTFGVYSLASQMDYPVAALLKTPDSKFFAVAAVASYDWGNDGSGNDGPCAPVPGSNPAPCVRTLGTFRFGEVADGLPNTVVPGANSVVPWQQTPQPLIVSSSVPNPGGPTPDLEIELSWPEAKVYSDLSVRPSWNPTLAPADPNAAPGVGVLDIQSKFGLVRYQLDVASTSDPNFSSPVQSFTCPGGAACTSSTEATIVLPVDRCVRLQTLFGKPPQTTVHTRADCRLGRCGDIGYGVTSRSICYDATCSPENESCDNQDNDCDGIADEYVSTCGTGECESTGFCSSGSDTCMPGTPVTETCDGLDNDCDGLTDGYATSCGVGECASTGTCTAGSDSCLPGMPAPESCDGLDNDCDGAIDGFATSCGVGQCASTGTCTAGSDSCIPGAPVSEVCDNQDNDCDGVTDMLGTSCGMGECASTGFCTGGIDSCRPGSPSGEVCDGLDNNCDGLTDNGAVIAQATTSISPTTLNINAQGDTFSMGLTLENICDPGNPQPIDGSLLGATWISRAGPVTLPDPSTLPCPDPGGGTLFERGISDNIPDRVSSGNSVTLRFNMPPDGDCTTLDGDRQDLLALLSDVVDGTGATICLAGTVSGIPFEACTTATVLNKGNR